MNQVASDGSLWSCSPLQSTDPTSLPKPHTGRRGFRRKLHCLHLRALAEAYSGTGAGLHSFPAPWCRRTPVAQPAFTIHSGQLLFFFLCCSSPTLPVRC